MKNLKTIDDGNHFSVRFLHAVNVIHMTRQKVSNETIPNCFRHEGFSEKDDEFHSDDDSIHFLNS